jgi:hypothetical protein
VVTDIVPYCQTALGTIGSGYLSPGLPLSDGLSGVGRMSEVVQTGGRLVCEQWLSPLPTG